MNPLSKPAYFFTVFSYVYTNMRAHTHTHMYMHTHDQAQLCLRKNKYTH